MTLNAWSVAYRKAHAEMNAAACEIAEAVAAGYTPVADLVAKFKAAKDAYIEIVNTKIEVS